MVVLKFGKDLFHDGFAAESGLGMDTELFTIALHSRHLQVVQIDNLPMAAHESLPLLFQIIRIGPRFSYCLPL